MKKEYVIVIKDTNDRTHKFYIKAFKKDLDACVCNAISFLRTFSGLGIKYATIKITKE